MISFYSFYIHSALVASVCCCFKDVSSQKTDGYSKYLTKIIYNISKFIGHTRVE